MGPDQTVPARLRWLAIAGIAAVLVSGGWLLRYTVLLDFPEYVDDLESESVGQLLSAMEDISEVAEDGDFEGAEERLDEIRDGFPDGLPSSEPQASISDADIERIGRSFSRVGLADPVGSVSNMFLLETNEAEGAEERCRSGLYRLGVQHGAHTRLVLWLNAHRCDEVLDRSRELLRSRAAEERSRLSAEQRSVVDAVCEEHGGLMAGGILLLHRWLQRDRVCAEQRRIGEVLAGAPPTVRTTEVLESRVSMLEREEAVDDRSLANCTLISNLRGLRYAELTLDCLDGMAEDTEVISIFVDLDRGEVLDEPPATLGSGVIWDAERGGVSAIDELVLRLRESTNSEGELPDGEAAAPWVHEASERSGCTVRYEPLGNFELADVTVACVGSTTTRRVTAQPRDR